MENDKNQRPPPRPPPAQAPSEPGRSPRLSSSELFREGGEVIIVHGNVEYRLRKTRLGKLILIK